MLRVYVYRPDKKEKELNKDLLYNAKGEAYKEPEKKMPKHPLDNISRPKIASSFIEVDR